MKNIKKAYQEILVVCEKYTSDNECFGDIKDMERSARGHLMLIEWKEKYGINISHDYNPYSSTYISLGEYVNIYYFGDAKKDKLNGIGRSISWSDDDKQPHNEWILSVGFSTGAYIFGDDYEEQKQLFQDFFKELKTYKPDFSDSHNHDLYWKIKNAKSIYTDFNEILKKYGDKNNSQLKDRKVRKLKDELKSLLNNKG